MSDTLTLLILSDVHYAGASEQRRGCPELEIIGNPVLRLCVRLYRNYIWRRDPFGNNHLLDHFIKQAEPADYIIANGDYSCDTAFIGLADPACCSSVEECLGKLRECFGAKLHIVLGDHELGKMSLFGGCGGMRVASWNRALSLGLQPFWELALGKYVLLGVTSSILALPVFEPEILPEERNAWLELRKEHLDQIRQAFTALKPDQRVLLFCHDPTALPFLWQDERIRAQVRQVEATIIGHLHSELFLWKSRLLSGMPTVTFLGNSIRRMSSALNQARLWRSFRVRLCPALAGIELLKDGGYCRIVLSPAAARPLEFQRLRLPG